MGLHVQWLLSEVVALLSEVVELFLSAECSQELVSRSFSVQLDNYQQDFVQVPNILLSFQNLSIPLQIVIKDFNSKWFRHKLIWNTCTVHLHK